MGILEALIHQERIASRRGELDEERREALDRYLGRPYGDEVEGRSHVVMRDVADTVEWIKPSLLKIFAAGDEVVRFDPVGPEDEEQSQQETDYCNHVLMSENNGFLVMHDWFHDAMLQRNGYVMVRATKKKTRQLERYNNLTDDELALLLQDKEVELVEHAAQPDAMGVVYHSAAVRQLSEYSCLEVVNIPPERALVAPDWPGVTLQGCPFVEVQDFKTVSQLREMGYEIEDTINDDAESDEDDFAEIRAIDGDTDDDDIEADAASRRVRVRYVWMNYDDDKDGIAELRRLVVVGKTILENEEDDLIPVACITPGRLPHEHIGQSIDDLVKDLQRIRTVLVRGFLDGMYLSMHGRNAIDVNRVNLDDLLVNRAGGIVRVQGDPSSAIFPMVQPQNGPAVLQAVEYIDGVRENRTGVTRYNQGLDANSLNKTASGISQIMSASQQKIELIARVFAETGVKALMLIIHAMSIKSGRQPQMLKLRNKWVPMDPRGWKTRRDVTVSVGIGTGNKDQMLQHLFMILQEQKQAMAIGLATPANLYNALKRITQNAGFKQAEEFWTDVSEQPPQPPQPNPDVMKAQAEIQSDQMRLQMDGQRLQAELAHKQQTAQIDLEKAKVELQIKMADLELRRMEMQLKAESAQIDMQIKQDRAVMQASDDMARARQIEGRDD